MGIVSLSVHHPHDNQAIYIFISSVNISEDEGVHAIVIKSPHTSVSQGLDVNF